jgi:hypothetical protein
LTCYWNSFTPTSSIICALPRAWFVCQIYSKKKCPL